jgi:anti-sigma factor RsiW
MSSSFDASQQCGAVQEELAELALGISSGRTRSDVLAHIGSCARCAADLEALSVIADSLLELAPEVEPPLGFELRLAERLGKEAGAQRARRSPRAAVLAAAAAVTILLGMGIGVAVAPRSASTPQAATPADLTSAHFTAHGHVVGELVISSEKPAWMFITIDVGKWAGKVTCEITTTTGAVDRLGVFELTGGFGEWGVPLRAPAHSVRTALLIASDGTVLAHAQV